MRRIPRTSAFAVTIVGLVMSTPRLHAEQAATPADPTPRPQGTPMTASIADNMSVELDYTLTADGQVVDSTEGRGPFTYVHGQGQISPGLERQLAGMGVGASKEITVAPEEGYGPVDLTAFIDVPKGQFPAHIKPEKGLVLQGVDPAGKTFRATISEIKDKTVTLDLNHPLAGKTLLFKVKVLNITPAR